VITLLVSETRCAYTHPMPRNWSTVHSERAALAAEMRTLTDVQWNTPSLCEGWTVEDVLAHLTAGASLNTVQWFAGVLRCRFDFDKQVAMRLAENLGATPAETLNRFERVITSTKVATGSFDALLGEVVVHSEDIRRPLNIKHHYPVEMVTRVAEFFVKRDFTVASKSMARGLRLEAVDGPFRAGAGAVVSGTTLALVTAMAGRVSSCDELTGAGVTTLRRRQEGGATAAQAPRT
jgi:uncharacterized protein (TIGR03083 family)